MHSNVLFMALSFLFEYSSEFERLKTFSYPFYSKQYKETFVSVNIYSYEHTRTVIMHFIVYTKEIYMYMS